MKPEEAQEQYTEKQIEDAKEGKMPQHKNINEAENGSMINDIEDLKRLGDEMEDMNTNSEDEEKGLLPDPQQ